MTLFSIRSANTLDETRRKINSLPKPSFISFFFLHLIINLWVLGICVCVLAITWYDEFSLHHNVRSYRTVIEQAEHIYYGNTPYYAYWRYIIGGENFAHEVIMQWIAIFMSKNSVVIIIGLKIKWSSEHRLQNNE